MGAISEGFRESPSKGVAKVSGRTRSSREHDRSLRARPGRLSRFSGDRKYPVSLGHSSDDRSLTQLEVPRVSRKGMEARSTLANATLQQHLTVVRLFHDFLVEERACTRNPLRPLIGGRGLIQRHHRLPWIPSEEEWQNILQLCKQEPLRNRVMLAMSYDAALRREEVCSLE